MPQDVTRDLPGFDDAQKRVISGTVCGVRIVNAYVVNGQAVGSEKYDYKLRFLDAFRQLLAAEHAAHAQLVVMGDFNDEPYNRSITDYALALKDSSKVRSRRARRPLPAPELASSSSR